MKPSIPSLLSVKVLSLNVRSMKKHYADVEALLSCLESPPPRILCFSETWLENSDNNLLYLLPGYNEVISSSRINRRGGGSMIQAGHGATIVTELNTSLTETTVALVQIDKQFLLVMNVYVPPRLDKMAFLSIFDKELESLTKYKYPIIITGDVNIDILKTNKLTKDYLSTLAGNGFHQTNNAPTRVSADTSSCIDHFIVKNIDEYNVKTLDDCFTDHFPLLLDFSILGNAERSEREYRDLSFLKCPQNSIEFENKLIAELNKRYQCVESSGDANLAYNRFHYALTEIFDKLVPLRKNLSRSKTDAGWFNKQLKTLINKRNKLHRLWIKDKENARKKDSFLMQRLKVDKAIRVAKKNFFYKKFADCIGDSRQVFQVLNEVTGKRCQSRQLNSLEVDGFEVYDYKEMANAFNHHFVSVGSKLAQSRPGKKPPKTDHRAHQSMYLFRTNENECLKVIQQLKSKHSSGPDNVSNVVLKSCARAIAPFIAELINISFESGVYPDMLKNAKVIPLYKSGCCKDLNNYRPISLLVSISKIFERVMQRRLYNYLEKYNLLYAKQFGFRKKHCTIDALAELTEIIRMGSKETQNISVFLDLKKAFDTLDHSILLDKLETHGVRGIANKWFESYLFNRMQFVEVNGQASDWAKITTGVPQGSVLGPLLFLVYINDIAEAVQFSQVYLFADDTNITSVCSSSASFQNDLSSICDWFLSNKLSVNVDKSSLVNFNRKRRASTLQVEINKSLLNTNDFCKYLGILVDGNHKFCEHVRYIRFKLARHSGVISKMRHYVPRSILLKYYFCNVKPIVQYGILVYGCTSFTVLEPILVMQRKIIRLIYFKSKLESVSKVFEDKKILTVHELYVYELIKFVCRSVNNLATTAFFKSFYELNPGQKRTRSSRLVTFTISSKRSTFHSFSLKHRGSKVLNFLSRKGLLPKNFGSMKDDEVTDFVHTFRSFYTFKRRSRKICFWKVTILMVDACRWLLRWLPGAKSNW